MNNLEKYLTVKIFGEEYKLIANNEEKKQELLAIVKLMNEKLNSLEKNFPHYSKTKISILACLNLADEIYKSMKEKKKDIQRIQNLCEFISKLIND